MDLSGKLIIKVQLGDDIRRIPIHNEDITYDELVLMMQRVYRGKLTSSDDIQIKYKDEDGDLVTIFDSTDLAFAIQCSRILKLTLIVNGQNLHSEGEQLKGIRQDLQTIRNIVNSLLDGSSPVDNKAAGDVDSTNTSDRAANSADSQSGTQNQSQANRNAVVKPLQPNSKEFDPLAAQRAVADPGNKIVSAFGLYDDVAASGRIPDRSCTPDSSSSKGSSASQSKQDQFTQQNAAYPTSFSNQPMRFPNQPINTVPPAQMGYSPSHQIRPGQPLSDSSISQSMGPPGQMNPSPVNPNQGQMQRAPQHQVAPVPMQPGYPGSSAPVYGGQPVGGYQMSQQVPQQMEQQQQQRPQLPPMQRPPGMSIQSQQLPQDQPPAAQPPPMGGHPNPAMFQQPAAQQMPHYGAYDQTQNTSQPQSVPAGPGMPMPTGQSTNVNPYSRGPGTGYSAGYPRPVNNYPAGYR